MLLFKPEHIEPILAGTKTKTRRIWKRQRVKEGSVQLAKTKMLSTEYFAKLRILGVKKRKLGQMIEAEAEREGYMSLTEYKAAWEKINGTSWDPDQEVLVVSFEVV